MKISEGRRTRARSVATVEGVAGGAVLTIVGVEGSGWRVEIPESTLRACLAVWRRERRRALAAEDKWRHLPAASAPAAADGPHVTKCGLSFLGNPFDPNDARPMCPRCEALS